MTPAQALDLSRGWSWDRADEATVRALEAAVAAAWDEGYREAIEDYGCDIPWGGTTSDSNPYREKS